MHSGKKDNFYPNAEIIIEKMLEKSGLSQNRFAEEILGIKGVNITKAKHSKKIPENWFVSVSEKLGLSKDELCSLCDQVQAPEPERVFWGPVEKLSQHLTGAGQNPRASDEPGQRSLMLREKDLPRVRYYRDLAQMDADALGEIQTWLNEMEPIQPGYRSWFRLEFQKRFPEFAAWKIRDIGEEGDAAGEV